MNILSPIPFRSREYWTLTRINRVYCLIPHAGKTTPNDPFLPKELIRRFKLKRGAYIQADGVQNANRPQPQGSVYPHSGWTFLEGQGKSLFRFDQLTTIQPKEKLNLESKDGRMTLRVLDLFCPLGKGQRSLIVVPPSGLAKPRFYMTLLKA